MCEPEGLHRAFSVTLAPAKPGNVAPFKGVKVDILGDATGKCDGHFGHDLNVFTPAKHRRAIDAQRRIADSEFEILFTHSA